MRAQSDLIGNRLEEDDTKNLGLWHGELRDDMIFWAKYAEFDE